MYLTTEKKAELIKKYGKSANDSGSTKCQIAIFTERINALTEKLKENHKDFVTQRSLQTQVGKIYNLEQKHLGGLYIVEDTKILEDGFI